MSTICKNCGCDRSHHKGGNGFLFGIIIGAILVFLLATDKGKRILRELSKSGHEVFDNLKQTTDLEHVEEEIDEMVAPVQEGIPPSEVVTNGYASSTNGGTSRVRKFFRGIKKK